MKNIIKIIIINFITLIRVIGIFAIIPVYLHHGGFSCFVLVAMCFLTDCIDGMLARELKCSTFFGSILDGVSDKAFLIINLITILSITKLAIFPIIIEVLIALTQSLKYAHNMNVQSNLMGKAKMWIAGFLISAIYILEDKVFLNSFNTIFTNYLVDNAIMVKKVMLIIVIIAELLTLISYIKEYIESKNSLDNTQVIKSKELQLVEEVSNKKLGYMLFNHEFYMQHKNNANLKFIRNLAKSNKKN